MTYLTLSLPFLFGAVLVALVSTVKMMPGERATHWRAVGISAVGLTLLTAVFDSLMIYADLFYYSEQEILGFRIGLAPIEDFAYPVAAVLLLPTLWHLLRRKGTSNAQLLRAAFIASRPVSWVNTAFPFAAGYVLTVREVDWLLVVGVLYFLVPYNLAMYGINDVFDYASDVQNPRKGGIEGALLPPRLHKPLLTLIAATNLPFLLVLAVAGSIFTWAALAISMFALLAYSVPGLRFKERPLLDSVTSSTHFVSPAVVGLTLAEAEWTPGLVLVLLAFGLWGMAAHAFGAVQDIVPDRAAGIGSIATVMGAKQTVRLALSLWLVAGLLMLATPWPGPLASLVAIPYIVNCVPWAAVSDGRAYETNRAWRRFIWLNYIAGFIVTVLFILWWRGSV